MDLKLMLSESLPVVTLTVGLSQRIKVAAGIQDGLAELLTVGIGLALTVALDYATLAPVTPQDWVLVGIHGLINGIATSGGYKAVVGMVKKAQTP